MEPGCALESTPQLITFFSSVLPSAAGRLGIREQLLQQHLGVCFDICHQAVMFEDPYDSLQKIHQAGIAIGKVQISSALVVDAPGDPQTRERLREYAEPRYLHQVRFRLGETLAGMADLPDALHDALPQGTGPWRVHFHVPIQQDTLGQGFRTTRDAIQRTLAFLRRTPSIHPHLEVETYTWQVLPQNSRPGNDEQLTAGIARELDWLEAEMSREGLLERPL
jgi:hypothetical protein